MDPPLRETMLVRGDVDAITGFTFTSLLNIEARGVKAEDVVVMQYADHGVKHYGNVIIASPKLIAENPEYGKVEFEKINEYEHPEIADQYDYYANPSMFIGKEKIYESYLFETREECRAHVLEVLKRAMD